MTVVPGQLAQRLRGLGIRSEVGAPVAVGGHVWGALIAGTDQPVPLPAGTEDRLARFAELIGTAVGNAADRAELVASRARIVAAGDAARLRLARDLHDGAQQRLVSVVMGLQLADQQRDDPAALRRLLSGALDNARAGIADLRELAAGMHPAILTNRGLRAAARSLADRCAVPVSSSRSGAGRAICWSDTTSPRVGEPGHRPLAARGVQRPFGSDMSTGGHDCSSYRWKSSEVGA